MPNTSLHLSVPDNDLLYRDPSLWIPFSKDDKTKPALLGRKRAPGSAKTRFLLHVSGDLHPRDHVLVSLPSEVKS